MLTPLPLRKLGALALAAFTFVSAQPALAAEDERDTSFSLLLNQDNFFGFYGSFNGLIELDEDTDFSFYGIQWTTPAFSTDGAGADLWTEFGVGLNFHAMDDKLMIKPQLGVLGGALQSGGEDDPQDGAGANFPDGVVPSLTINYSGDKYEAEWYSGYYIAAQGQDSLDFLHVWLNAGYKFSQYVSAGGHVEYLSETDAIDQSFYTWVGPYVQFSLPQGVFARLSAGADVDGSAVGQFYKLTVGTSF